MYNFVVLGLVPGTQFQITFLWWLASIGVALSARLILTMRRRRTFVWLQLILAFYAMTLRQPKAL